MSSKIFVKIHAVLRKLHMIKHMTTLTMCPISQGAPSLSSVLTMIPICPHYDHVPNCPCAPLPMCPIPQGTPSLFNITHDTPLSMCPIAHVSCCTYQKRCQVVRKMSSCQKDVKLSKRCQMSKSQTHGLWRRFTKKINSHNEVHTY